jgi:hypothetical protein
VPPLPELRRGRIVWAVVRDRRGFAKERPVIVLTATADIAEDEPLEVMAITTTFPSPTPLDHIELPWHPLGRTSTRLRKRSAAVLTWLAEIHPNDILELHGDVPTPLMIRVLGLLGLPE